LTSKKVRYWVSLFVALTFLIGLISPAVATGNEVAAGLTDISDHWAKDKITQWVSKGLVSGYTDGTFKPDKSITRAEFMTLVNKAFNFSEKASIDFSDVMAGDWFYAEVAKAVKAGYISGYQDGTAKPNREISRQEAAVALCKALNLEAKDTDEIDKFTDKDSIPLWSRPYICILAAEGYMGGYPDGSFKAERHINRAETVTMLDKALGALKVSYDLAGIYGPEEGIETVPQDVAINVPGVTLRNMIIEGDLYLNEGIGEGDVTLENVTVKGTTTIRGGGKDSIHLVNFTGQEIIVIKVGGRVRIVASGDTTVEELILESGAHIEGNGIASVTVLKPGEDVILDGDFENVSVEANAKVEVLEGTTINNLQVNSSADINLANGATVKDLTIDAPAAITGQGTIQTATINADGAKLEPVPKKVEMAKGVTAEIAGKEVKEDKTPSKGGGGGGGGDDGPTEPTVIEVQSVSLDKSSVTLAVYEAVYQKSVTLTATIHPGDATNKKVTWSSNNKDVATIKSDGLKATVEAVGEGKATITVTTDDGGKTAKCEVKVVASEIPVIPVSAISVAPKTLTLTAGATGKITATVDPDDATNKKVNWSSSNPEIATVDDKGNVEAIAAGTATITATSDANSSKKDSCVVTVVAALTITKINVVDGADGVTFIVTPAVGQVIRANIILSDGTPIYTYPVDSRVTYKWYYAESTDTILGTEGSYTVTSDNVGKTICVEVKVEGIGEATWTADGSVVDKTSLKAKVAEVADLVEADYTAETWAALQTALEAANAVIADEDATQEQVDDALQALQAAIEGLVEAEVLEAPADGLKDLSIPGLTVDDVRYLVFGLKNEAGTAQKVATLAEVKDFIEKEYGVTFNANAIKVEEGKLSIDGSILSKADWRKVKAVEPGDPSKPYRITVLITDKTNKVAKIAMYEDGVAVIEDLQELVSVPSTYSFSFVEPDKIVANQPATIDVTFANDEPAGDYGYDGVRFKFSVTGDGDAIFSAVDSEGNPYEATNEGYWGPISGFAIGAEYDETTPWTVTFTEAGEYTITVSLIEAPDGEVVAGITDTFTVNVQAEEPAIIMTVGEPTIEDGKVTLAVTTKNTGADYANARYGIKVNVADVEGDTISVSYGDEGLTFNLNRVEGSNNFIGYFGPADGFTITKDWDVTTIFTVGFGTFASDRTVKVDAWVNQGAEPAEEGAVARMDQVVITVPATEPEEYHTYKFNIADLAAEYLVSEGLESPTDAAFTGMTPVKLSIVVDETKDKPYAGKVRVAPVGADNLQLWAKDTKGNWYDINVVGWGPGEGFPIDTTLITDVYVVATVAFDGSVTLKLVDVTGDFGVVDNIIISQDVAFKAVIDEAAALDTVNSASSADNYAAVKTALEENAAKLGLDLTEYEKLTPEGRKNAVANDIYNNKPGGGYTIETLKPMFDEIVATRMVFQNSVALFAEATTENPLTDLSYIAMLQENLNAVTLQEKHSGRSIKEDILLELNGLVNDFNALTKAQQTAVLAGIDYTKNTSSTATRNALRTALNAQAAIDARLAITSVTVDDNKAYASTAAQGGTVRVLGYGVGINLDAKSEGKKISDTTSIVVKLYKGDTLSGQQTFNATGYSKHGDKSAISGTIDAGGQYVATSWDNSWSAGIDNIPDKAVATVQYTDGTAIAELDLEFTEAETKIFSAAEKVHALFENVFADELVLAANVTQEKISEASALVEAVTVKQDQNKAVLQELITQAQGLLLAKVNASQLRITDENQATDTIAAVLTEHFGLTAEGTQLEEIVSLFWFNNYHYVDKFTFKSLEAVETALEAAVTEYEKIITTFQGTTGGYDDNVKAVESYLASAARLAATSSSGTRTVADEIAELAPLYSAGYITAENKISGSIADQVNTIKDAGITTLIGFLTQLNSVLEAPKVTFEFVSGFDGFKAGVENSFSIKATATNIDDTTRVKYKATLKKDESLVANQVIWYEEGTPGNWKSFTTNESGVAYFGPGTGFTMVELDLSQGVKTGFKATIDEDGSYALTVELIKAADLSTIGEAGIKEFIVAEANVTNTTQSKGYDTIQAAINEAAENDIITVSAGTYAEALSIGKSLTILGVNADKDAGTPAFLDAGSIVTGGIRITAGDVTIKGLTIETKGILASDITGLTLVNNRIAEIGQAMEGSPAGSIIGIDVMTLATGPIVINQNRFSGIGATNSTGTAIRIVQAADSITITNNIIENVTKNGINLYANCLANGNAKLTITGNEITNWDSDKDQVNPGGGEIGGRAIRIDFAGAHTTATADITENKLTPPSYGLEQTPVDPEYVKLTKVDIVVDLTKNYWGSESPAFGTILLVEGTKAADCAYVPYYTDEEMTTLAESVEPEVNFIFTGLDDVTAGGVNFSITIQVTDNKAIANDTPLRYKAVITKDGSALANHVIKYPEAGDNWPDDYHIFTTDSNGTAYFGPSTGFTLTQLSALLSTEGVTTPFQADFEADSYSVTVSLLDISEGEVELGSGTKTFTVTGSES
jgi:uncharacterized protein YjdB